MKGIEAAFEGRLVKDAELRTTQAGREWMLLTVVVGEGDKEQWLTVGSWSHTIQELAPTLAKGVEIYVEGKLTLRTWGDGDGATKAGLNVQASVVQPLALIGHKKPKRPRAAAKAAGNGAQHHTGASATFHQPQTLPFNDDIGF